MHLYMHILTQKHTIQMCVCVPPFHLCHPSKNNYFTGPLTLLLATNLLSFPLTLGLAMWDVLANDISANKTKVHTEAWVGWLVLGFLFLLTKAKRRLDNLGLRTDLSFAHGRKACNLEPLSRAQLAKGSERINNFKLQTMSVRQVCFCLWETVSPCSPCRNSKRRPVQPLTHRHLPTIACLSASASTSQVLGLKPCTSSLSFVLFW